MGSVDIFVGWGGFPPLSFVAAVAAATATTAAAYVVVEATTGRLYVIDLFFFQIL